MHRLTVKSLVLGHDNLKRSLIPVLIAVFFSLSLGIIFYTTVAPRSIPDPDLHTREIYALATGQAFEPTQPYTDDSGNDTNVQYLDVDSRIANAPLNNALVSSLITLPNSTDATYEIQYQALTSSDDEAMTTAIRRSQYFPLVYAPQALAVSAATAIGGTPWDALQAARLINFILALCLELAAIVILPKGKMLYAIIASLPTTVFLAVSISLDAIVPGLAMLLIALIVLSLTQKTMSLPSAIACCLITTMLFFFKMAYATLGLLLLILPDNVLSKRKKIVICIAICIATLPIYAIWKMNVSFSFTPLYNLDMNTSWALQHPFALLARIAVTIGDLPHFILILPSRYIVLGILLFVTLLFCLRNTPHKSSPGIRSFIIRWRLPIMGLLCCLISLCGMCYSFALGWNDLATATWSTPLEGMQERYLIPLLPLLALFLFPVENAVTNINDPVKRLHMIETISRSSGDRPQENNSQNTLCFQGPSLLHISENDSPR